MKNTNIKEPVYIIIPVHNRKQITLSCLENLEKNGDLDRYHTVIIDDGSTDGTTEAIKSQYPNVTLLPGDGNLWWTGAMALGMQYAYKQGAEYFIWLNDDCLPDLNTLPQLVEFLKKHPDSIAAPSFYTQENNLRTKHCNGAKGKKTYAANTGEIIEVDSMSGWCVAISAAVVSKTGFPDAKKFPHYCGDDMYILKASRSGFKAYLVGDFQARLIGKVNEMGNFKRYFRPDLSVSQIFSYLFWNKKSPYRLPTKIFYFIDRYGYFVGMLLFFMKLSSWLTQYLYLQIILWSKPSIISKYD